MDLLRWWRFLVAVDVDWRRATRIEARDFSGWIQLTVKHRRTSLSEQVCAAVELVGPPNPVTGKAALGPGYAPATIAHSETVLRGFYDFQRDVGAGPILNPFPLDIARRSERANAHHNPMEAWKHDRVGRYSPKCRSGFRGRYPTIGSTRCSLRCRRIGTGPWLRSGSQPEPARPSCWGFASAISTPANN